MSAGSIARETVDLARRYLAQPEPFWEGAPDRQVRKLQGMLRSATRSVGRSLEDVIEEILAIARLRTHHAPAPIYLPNIGSSGSHWLEAMLARATGAHACGEVYFPKALLESLPAGTNAQFFMHAVLALHTGGCEPQLVSGRFINSAHISRVSRVADRTPGSLRVLLVRHPMDVVMSRTLRKPEYRQDVAPDLDDKEYLERNCKVVERFYLESAKERYDATVRYEDLLADPVGAMTELIDRLGMTTTTEALTHAIQSTSPEAVKGAAERGERKATNLFIGQSAPVSPQLRQLARKRLSDCCKQLGYSIDAAKS